METKKCYQCKVIRTLDHFKGIKVEYTKTCDMCKKIQAKHKKKKKSSIIVVGENELICASCHKPKTIDQFKSKTNDEIIKTCLTCREMKNRYKYKKFNWIPIEISKAKKEFDEKYKFYVLKPIVSWALKQSYKKCTRCKKNYDFDQFISERYKFTETNVCLKCRTNNNINRKVDNTHYEKLRGNIEKLKIEMGPCIECGETNLKVLEFDHIDTSSKVANVTALRSIEKMNLEAKKCQILCRMCHTKKSVETMKEKFKNYEKNDIIKRNQDHVKNIKLKINKCTNCDKKVSDYIPECFDFDHIDPTTKFMDVSDMVSSKYCIKKIDNEIQKCQLLCGYCHKLKTLEQNKTKQNKTMMK